MQEVRAVHLYICLPTCRPHIRCRRGQCGDGKFLGRLKDEREFQELVGMDVSANALSVAHRRLKLDRLPEHQRDRIELLQGSLTYKDKRLSGFDAATCIEVVEHLDPPRLESFARTIFEYAKPPCLITTAPAKPAVVNVIDGSR